MILCTNKVDKQFIFKRSINYILLYLKKDLWHGSFSSNKKWFSIFDSIYGDDKYYLWKLR